jgi:sugar-specific transcriptional regulator TrmB
MTNDTIVTDLEQLGFTSNEASVYLVLIQKGALTATALAAATRLARTAVYPTINSLVDQGLVEAGAGYGSKFSAVPAERALPHLMLERERLTRQVVERISALEEPEESVSDQVIQVIRNPRAVLERFERLQLEAEHEIAVFSKPPYFNRGGNEAEEKALRRGVRARAIYEKAGLEDPAIKPYFRNWIAAGEEARIYDGELPHKLAVFDSKVALMPLIVPGHQAKTVLIRHPQMAQTLSLGFEYLWERSEPIAKAAGATRATRKSKPDQNHPCLSHNGRRARPAKKYMARRREYLNRSKTNDETSP